MTVGNQENPQVSEAETEDENAVSIFDEITGDSNTDSGGQNRVLDVEDSEDDNGFGTQTDDSDDSDEAEAKPDDAQSSQKPGDDNGGGDEDQQSQKELEALQRDHKANAGRVRGLNKKLAEARDKIRKMQDLAEGGDGPTEDEISELEKDFPEAAKLARAYADRIRRDLQADLRPVHDAIDSSFEQQQQDINSVELGRLEKAHPDYAQVVTDRGFSDWMQRQSEGIKALYASDSADDAIVLLNLYKGAVPASQSQGNQAQAKRNNADLSQHAELPRKGASRAGTEPDDPIEIFDSIT